MKNKPARRSGILLLDKPTGITSAKAVATVRHALGKPKVGHLGTLDPFASGLLPLCIGEATKIAPFLNTADKAYRGVLELGLLTDTLDGTGEVLERCAEIPDTGTLDLAGLAAEFSGSIEQVPPAYSAIKKDGVRMYKLAREGRAPELEPRTVTIHGLTITIRDPTHLELDVSCSKGTYIRSLSRDIGSSIGCGATLVQLERTVFGDFQLSDTISLEAACDSPDPPMVTMSRALSYMAEITVDEGTAADLRQGRQYALGRLGQGGESDGSGELRRIMAPEDDLVAVVRAQPEGWGFERVFAPAESCAPQQ
jgi:tRNA pseudouridine55 synthase